MIRKVFGTARREETRDQIDPQEAAHDRFRRIRERGQDMAERETFAKAPPVRRNAPTVEPVDEQAEDGPEPQPSEVHEMQERLVEELAPPETEPEPEPETQPEPEPAPTIRSKPTPAASLAPAPGPIPPRPKRPHPALRKVRTQAIMFKQHVPPLPDDTHLSFWGGLPMVPEGFEWPSFTTPEGNERALSFVGQLDCAAIPEHASFHLLPATGQLLFFMDLHWGAYWEYRVVHVDADASDLAPAPIPEALPPLYDDHRLWPWASCQADWPHLLPRWTFDPVTLHANDDALAMDGEAERTQAFWPGAIDRQTAEAAVTEFERALPASKPFAVTRDKKKALVRPFAHFPQDWQAVRIACGHLERHLDDLETRCTKKAAKALTADLADWRRKLARAEQADRSLSKTARGDFWAMLKRHDKLVEPRLAAIVTDSVEASFASGETDLLPAEASRWIAERHRFGAGDERMLCAPTFVEMEAEERVGEWLLLLEMGGNPGLGHHFAEGVYQYWIKPEDLAAGNFDRVELSAESY